MSAFRTMVAAFVLGACGRDAEQVHVEDPPTTCCGCLCVDPTWSCAQDTCLTADGLAYKLAPEAGFMELEPGVLFPEGSEERARMWYAFWPADKDPEKRPLVLFFQGGPYAGTFLLWGGNTDFYTLDPAHTKGRDLAPNPYRWTRFANLLYVDSPFAGFSYVLGRGDQQLRTSAKSEAAAYVRFLLRFLARHPKLERAPVALVGESFGGYRATQMLRQLLNYEELREPASDYYDRSLADEIHEHLRRTRAAPERETFAPEEVAEQFGTQILIQGTVTTRYQTIFSESYVDPDTNPRCVSDQTGPGWIDKLLQPDVLSAFTGVDVESIRWLHAEERVEASVCLAFPLMNDVGDLEAVFGPLSEHDSYYTPISCQEDFQGWLSELRQRADLEHQFADNLRHVATFSTNSPCDPVVGSLNIVSQLRLVPGVRSVEVADLSKRVQEIVVTFDDGTTRNIRFPTYAKSRHSISLFEPDLLAQDVRSWLEETLGRTTR